MTVLGPIVEIKCPACGRVFSTAPGSVNRCERRICAFPRFDFQWAEVIAPGERKEQQR